MSSLDHHKLEVYRRALALLETCDRVVEHLPARRSHLRDQLDRSATSVVANIAEGAGEYRPKEKARFYRMARRSGIEIAAWLDMIAMRRDIPEPIVRSAVE